MTSRQYQWITAGVLFLALVGVAFSWRWADQSYRTGARMPLARDQLGLYVVMNGASASRTPARSLNPSR